MQYKILQWAIGIFISISTGIHVYALSQVAHLYEVHHAMDKRLTAIEANRFTSHDAQKLMQTLLESQRHLDKLIARLPEKIPPPWFQAQITTSFERVNGRIQKLESKIEKLEHRK